MSSDDSDIFSDDYTRYKQHFRNIYPDNHERFWFEDGEACIIVDGSRYKLHASLLKRHSPFLRNKLRAIPSRAAHNHRRDDLILEVKKDAFELILSLLYPPTLGTLPHFTETEWASVLEAASQLELTTAVNAAMKHLGRRGHTAGLLRTSMDTRNDALQYTIFKKLCTRSKGLTPEEGEILGVKKLVAVANARERCKGGADWDTIWADLRLQVLTDQDL